MVTTKYNPKKYIIENGRKLPIHMCLISDDYINHGLTICLLVRKQPSGKYTFAQILLDRYCLGIKNCLCNCNLDQAGLETLIERSESNGKFKNSDPVYFHNLIYASIDFAAENGFGTPKDFGLAEKILDPDYVDNGIDEIKVGEDGMPVFINGPYDDVDRIIATLNRNVGEGNYKVTHLG